MKKSLSTTDRCIGRVHLQTARHMPSIPRSKNLPEFPQTPQPATTYLCQIRVDGQLLEVIENAVQSAKRGGDFRYGNRSDFIRKALREYQQGTQLAGPFPFNRQQARRTTIWLDEDLYAFWKSLPQGSRCEILDRVLRTKIARG